MKNILLAIVLLFGNFLFCQEEGIIMGNITDNELHGEPLLFANVSLKNTQWKAQTNFNGNFEINGVTPGSYTLVVSFLGYETLEMPIKVSDNSIVEIREGLGAQSISLGDISALPDASEEFNNPVASIAGSND